ncbi:MAG: hydrogenase maturation nickel metallochaperone HypA [Erysipelotrichaceae bacterium]
MHELGVLSAVIKTIEGIKEQENLTHIEKVVLQVGELSGILPHYLEECYPAAVYKTFMENTKLEMDIVKGQVLCNDCNTEFNGVECDLRCPKCGGQNLTALSGKEFIIKEIVGY